ncbi:MAG: alpha/beta fold hydrolase [Alphaproteobacteria bacterium]|nr:alpha/beta fold hydrolase [Alphaproteobacteria bacterium]
MLPLENKEETISSWSTFLKTFQEQNQQMASTFFKGMQQQMPIPPTVIGDVFIKAAQKLLENPALILEAQGELLRDINELWEKMFSNEKETIPQIKLDKRFRHDAWDTVPYFFFMKEYYLMTSRWLQKLISQFEGLDELTNQKLKFYMNHLVEAVSPTNFPFTNPEVLEELVKTDGASLKNGIQTLLDDMTAGQWMKMTNPDAFELGETIATSKGEVVYRNELFELIHYYPLTETQYTIPLLIVPPWINKYYIFDLSPNNSFVKWMLEKGHNVFIISWVNPGPELASKTFEDYFLDGAYRACELVSTLTQCSSLHTMGYCVGGNLLAALSAYLAKKPAPFSFQSMTLLATIIDFSQVGDLKIFMDEEYMQYVEKDMMERGVLDATKLKSIFSMLRPNELVWSFFIKNYLLGQVPPAFDFLYWNSDSISLPASLHLFVLRKWFQENLLMKPGGIEVNGVPLDLSDITTPTILLSTIEDHISPWKSSYPAAQLFKGPLQFILAGSGHVAGVMNPPARNKYGFFTNHHLPPHAGEWLKSATKHEGSWWTLWNDWLAPRSGRKVVPQSDYPFLGAAPGTYVKEIKHSV